jgi:nucleotide-binding universal stress UspA family protein
MESSPQHRDRLTTTPDAMPTTVIVVGIDGSDSSWDAFWWASGEAHRLHGRVVATFVSPTADANVLVASAALAGTLFDYAAIDKISADRFEHLKHQIEGYAADHDVPLTFVRARGDVATELLRVAETYHADLIVVGKSSKMRHHLAGSLGRRLIGKRRTPVVVVVP